MKRPLLALLAIAAIAGLVAAHGLASARGRAADDAAKFARLAQSRPAALKSAAATVEKFKQQAIRAGRYRCCLKHPCDYCALHLGTCPCDAQLDAGKPVCSECKGGWYAGDGEAKGKTADQIKTFPRR
jgi:hypothetical protein